MLFRKTRALLALCAAVSVFSGSVSALAADPAAAILTRVKAASPSVRDIKASMVVTSINKQNAVEMNRALSNIGQFTKATVYYKRPDMFRADGVARGMAVSYVVSGNRLQVVIPGLLKKVQNVSKDVGKQRSPLDMGFITEALWSSYNVTYAGKEGALIKLKLDPKWDSSKRHVMVWVDSTNLRLARQDRYSGGGQLKAKYMYAHVKMFGKLPVATLARVYGPDGGYVGTIEYQNMKVNTGIPDSLFSLIK